MARIFKNPCRPEKLLFAGISLGLISLATPVFAESDPIVTTALDETVGPTVYPLEEVQNPFATPEGTDEGEAMEAVELSLEEDPKTGEASAPPSAESKRRGLPAPFDSPPFPSADWPIGGTTVIGAPDTTDTFLLMETLYKTQYGEALKRSRIKISGWANVGANISTSENSNFPVSYSVFSNRADLDQLVIRIERIPDTVQREHIDWGFHIDNLYGIDYRFTTAKGIFSDQLLKKNRQYGYDPVLFYGELYIPWIAKGMNIRVGRYLSVPDIEAQLAVENYMYTHSLMYTVDPYTQTGVMTTTKLSDHWQIQLGMSVGNDVALWSRKALLKPTGTAMLHWISKNNKDSIYAGVNAINDGNFTYNNLQHFVGTWSHKFNERLHTKTEGYYMYQKNVPDIGFAPVWGAVNYLVLKLTNKCYMTLRNDYLNDVKGQRTGFKNHYTSHGIGLTYWFNKSVALRPEFRFDQAYDTKAYDNGRKKGQFLGAVDLIYRF